MATFDHDSFIRLPTGLLEALLPLHLSGGQCRVFLWVIRNTFGWNRKWTPFTWYRIAQALDADRPTVYRAGRRLLQIGLLVEQSGHLAIQLSFASNHPALLNEASVAEEQRWITQCGGAQEQRKPLSPDNAPVVRKQRFSVERKTGVKAELQRRRGGGYVDNAVENDAVRELMNFYGALTGEALSAEQTTNFYKRFHQSAKVLLDACSGNLHEAKALLQQSLAKKPET